MGKREATLAGLLAKSAAQKDDSMDEHSQQQINEFFDLIALWRAAYVRTRLHYLAKRHDDGLILIKGRITLDCVARASAPTRFAFKEIEASQVGLEATVSVEQILSGLVGADGFLLSHGGRLRIPREPNNAPYVSRPIHFHPEGLNTGNRLAVLTVTGTPWGKLLPQPQTDWQLRAADFPFDSMQELSVAYGLGALEGDRSTFDVVAKTVIEVLAKSTIADAKATVGLWMAKAPPRLPETGENCGVSRQS